MVLSTISAHNGILHDGKEETRVSLAVVALATSGAMQYVSLTYALACDRSTIVALPSMLSNCSMHIAALDLVRGRWLNKSMTKSTIAWKLTRLSACAAMSFNNRLSPSNADTQTNSLGSLLM